MRALLLVLFAGVAWGALPVVLFHGMGDSAFNTQSMGRIAKLIEKSLGRGTVVYSLRFGTTELEDELSGFFDPAHKLIASTCAQLRALKLNGTISGQINAVGFSQGGQFLRAYVEQCNDPPVHNLVTLGGQHQGVYGLPHCRASKSWICDELRRIINEVGVYSDIAQRISTQANYWHDANDEPMYRKRNLWLPIINNDGTFNATYKANMASLNRFVMVKFLNDTMVQPRESSHFGWYQEGSSSLVVVPLNKTRLYTDAADVLALRQLDQTGRLIMVDTLGDHLQFTDKWFVENIVQSFLN